MINLGEQEVKAHKFVLLARSNNWNFRHGPSSAELDLSGEFSSHKNQLCLAFAHVSEKLILSYFHPVEIN